MPKAIEISDVLLTGMAADQMTPFMVQSGVSWYWLSIIFQNGSDKPIYPMTDIRRIQYEGGRRVLVVQLSELEAPRERFTVSLPNPPHYRVVGAGEEVTIVNPLSSPITFIETTADGVLRPRQVRLAEDVDSIECAVAYETELPAPASDLTAWEVPEHPRRSGNTVTASWMVSPSRSELKKTSE